MSEPIVKSPCILVCAIEPNSGHCYGCGRSREEIGGWMMMTDAERDAVMATLPERVSKLERRPRRQTRRSRMAGNRERLRDLPMQGTEGS